ncbi:MAG: hypothetical protein MZU97_00670 [Bacillus subtilis]|nr:hypothetical protein [Bacillus subtilis]
MEKGSSRSIGSIRQKRLLLLHDVFALYADHHHRDPIAERLDERQPLRVVGRFGGIVEMFEDAELMVAISNTLIDGVSVDA